MNLHWIYSPELALQNNFIFSGCDVIWRQLAPFDLPPWICHLRFYYFLKSQEITEINTNQTRFAYGPYKMYKLVNFWNSMEKNANKIVSYVKKLIFGQTHMKFTFAMATWRNTGAQLTYQNFCQLWMKKSLHSSQVAHQAGAYPGFSNMKRLGEILLPPGCNASPSQG